MAKALVVVLAVAALLVLVYSLLSRNPEELARARTEAATLEAERNSVLALVEERDNRQEALRGQRDARAREASLLRDSVAGLERARAAAQLTVRRIRTVGALQRELRTAFPELGEGGWGLTTIPIDERDTLGIEYLLVPAWFAETFIIDHANAESWRAQKEKLLTVDSLRLVIAALQDSVVQLEADKTAAYAAGYQAAYVGYQDLSAPLPGRAAEASLLTRIPNWAARRGGRGGVATERDR